MNKMQDYSSYNQLNKKYKVVVMKINQVINNQNMQDQNCLVLFERPDVVKPPKRPNRQPSLRKLIMDLRNDLTSLRNDFNNVIKLNNLKTK